MVNSMINISLHTSRRPHGHALITYNLNSIQEMVSILALFSSQDENGRMKGFGFVSYSKSSSAAKATMAMHGKTIDGACLYVAPAQKKADRKKVLEQRWAVLHSNIASVLAANRRKLECR